MSFLSTSIVGIDTIHDFLRTEQPVWFDNRPFPMHPFGLNGIQPGAFTRQSAGQDAYPLPGLLDVVIVLPQPGPHLVAEVPRRVVPDQQHRGEPLRRSRRAAPGEQGGGLGADRAACPTAQQHWFGLGGDVTHHQAIAGQRLRLRISVGPRFFSQAHGRLVRRPGLQRRLRQATPPDCITKAQSPRWMGDGERHPSSVMLGSKGSPCWNTFAWSVAGSLFRIVTVTVQGQGGMHTRIQHG
jgi:hypothetical protein